MKPKEKISLDQKNKFGTELIPETVMLLDFSLLPVYLSPSVGLVRGFTLDEIRHIPLINQITTDSSEKLQKSINQIINNAQNDSFNFPSPQNLIVEFICKDGSTIWQEVRLELAIDDYKNPIGLFAALRNMHKEVEVKEQLQTQMEFI